MTWEDNMSIAYLDTKTARTEEEIKYRGRVKNKREFFRLNEHLRIEVRAIKNSTDDEIIGDSIFGRTGQLSEHVTIDVSAGGLQFFSNGYYRENMHVEITVYFKDTEPYFDPVIVRAIILRSEQVENSQNYNVSAMYVNMNPKDRSQIERYIFVRQREMIAERRIGFL